MTDLNGGTKHAAKRIVKVDNANAALEEEISFFQGDTPFLDAYVLQLLFVQFAQQSPNAENLRKRTQLQI